MPAFRALIVWGIVLACCVPLAPARATTQGAGSNGTAGGPAEHKRAQLLFQELEFNWPTDRFLLVEFDARRGQFDKPRRISLSEAMAFAVPTRAPDLIAFLPPQGGGPYRHLYERSARDDEPYRHRFVRVADGETRFILHGGIDAHLRDGEVLYVWNHELRSKHLDSGKERIVERHVSDVAVQGDRTWVFSTRGSIFKITPRGRQRVTMTLSRRAFGAGPIDERWLWVFLRRNEKAPGALWLLDTGSGTLKPGPADWGQLRLIRVITS